ncbi:MAG: hypothetical protein IPH62_06565 [Ignavibacteriae bacterium]|nr:hypothetical protein [Ignavibacteriota bacterium]
MSILLFNISLVFLITHEMDAVRCKEWRIFPVLSLLTDKLGFTIFSLAHIPLFGLLAFYLLNSNNIDSLIYYLEIFFIAHLILHLLYLCHPKNEFKDCISWILIITPAVLGFTDLAIV